MAGNLSHSMRANYEEHGVEEYYRKVGNTYRNPHFSGVRACINGWMSRWWQNELQNLGPAETLTIFDMACGNGEATIAILDWFSSCIQNYRSAEDSTAKGTSNPSSARRVKDREEQVFINPKMMKRPRMIAADPFTCEAFRSRTGLECSTLSFQDITNGQLPHVLGQSLVEGEVETSKLLTIDMVVCSFALHLLQSTSELFSLLYELSTKARWLVILAPHKKPEIKEGWGWSKWDVDSWARCPMTQHDGEILRERTHCRVYKSLNLE